MMEWGNMNFFGLIEGAVDDRAELLVYIAPEWVGHLPRNSY